MALPTAPSTTLDATPAFLTAALRAAGTIGPRTAVTGLTHTQIAEGVALSGQLARLRLAYAGPPGPDCVVLKLPPLAAENRAVGGGFGFYVREARFYAELAPALPVRLPTCYGSAVDDEEGSSVLLLEDLGGWRPGCQITGADADEALAAVLEMAALHAYGWDAGTQACPAGPLPGWLHRFDDPLHLMMGQLYRHWWPAFVDAYGAHVGPAALEVGERVQAVFEDLQRVAAAEAPLTLVHGDWRMDNLLFEAAGAVAVVDWQVVHLGPAVEDLAMFLSQSLPVELRRRQERALVRAWYDRLSARVPDGLGGYSFDVAWAQYRRMTLFTTVYPVCVSVAMNLQNDRGGRLLREMMTRTFAAVADLDALELLP